MKILLDECLPLDVRRTSHEVHTAKWTVLMGLKNGQLLRDGECGVDDVCRMTDQGIPHLSSAPELTRSQTFSHLLERFYWN